MKQIQIEFLNRVSHKVGNDRLMAIELAETLDISKSVAYNKLSGDSLLTMPQIVQLCEKYDIDFSINPQKTRAASTVRFMPFHATQLSVGDYINSLEVFLARIATGAQKKLTCATDDIPIFHLFKYPEITAFKLHFWNARVRKNEIFKFDYKWPGTALLATAKHLHSLYQSIPSVEIWTKSSLLNTVEQIKYAVDAKIVTDKVLGRLLCQQLRQTLQDIEGFAINCAKAGNEKALFEWYFYEIVGCITYLAETDGDCNAFLRFNTFNTLQTGKGPLCDEVKHWFDGLVQDSTGFSGHGSRYRTIYMEQAYQTCNELEAMF